MHVETRWLIHPYLMLMRYQGNVTRNCLLEGQSIFLDQLNQVDDTLHLIIEMAEDRQFASDIINLETVREVANPILRHRNRGWVIVVDPNPHPVFKVIGLAVTQVTQSQLFICTTRDRALDFLKTVDERLLSYSNL